MKLLYHASSQPDLTHLRPQHFSARRDRKKAGVYASDSRAYASAFSFFWTEEDEIQISQDVKNGKTLPFYISFPLGFKKDRLLHPCSLYLLDSQQFEKMESRDPEWFTSDVVPIVREIKFKTALICMESSKLYIRWDYKDGNLIDNGTYAFDMAQTL